MIGHYGNKKENLKEEESSFVKFNKIREILRLMLRNEKKKKKSLKLNLFKFSFFLSFLNVLIFFYQTSKPNVHPIRGVIYKF